MRCGSRGRKARNRSHLAQAPELPGPGMDRPEHLVMHLLDVGDRKRPNRVNAPQILQDVQGSDHDGLLVLLQRPNGRIQRQPSDLIPSVR